MRLKSSLRISVTALSIVLGVFVGKGIVTRAVESSEPGKPSLARAMPPPPRDDAVAGRAVSKVVHLNDDTSNWIRVTGSNQRGAVSPMPGHLVVDARGHLFNSQAHGRRYRWSLRVLRDGKPAEVVREFGYDHQAFTVPPGEGVTHAFHEEVPLPSGRYTALLQLEEYADVLDERGRLRDRYMPWARGVVTQDVH